MQACLSAAFSAFGFEAASCHKLSASMLNTFCKDHCAFQRFLQLPHLTRHRNATRRFPRAVGDNSIQGSQFTAEFSRKWSASSNTSSPSARKGGIVLGPGNPEVTSLPETVPSASFCKLRFVATTIRTSTSIRPLRYRPLAQTRALTARAIAWPECQRNSPIIREKSVTRLRQIPIVQLRATPLRENAPRSWRKEFVSPLALPGWPPRNQCPQKGDPPRRKVRGSHSANSSFPYRFSPQAAGRFRIRRRPPSNLLAHFPESTDVSPRIRRKSVTPSSTLLAARIFFPQ